MKFGGFTFLWTVLELVSVIVDDIVFDVDFCLVCAFSCHQVDFHSLSQLE